MFRDKIVSMADVGAGVEESVVTFEGIQVLTPRFLPMPFATLRMVETSLASHESWIQNMIYL